MRNLIEEGDIVSVSFNEHIFIFQGIVCNVPCATGDSWIIEEIADVKGRIHYISEGCTVTLLRKKNETK